jgi:hypothetical protein
MKINRTQEVVNDCREELLVNFEKPAIEIIAQHGARLGITYEQMSILIDRSLLAELFKNPKTVN